MSNGIYALANPCCAGGTLSLNEELNIKTDNKTNFKASFIELFEKYADEPVIGKNTYEKNKGLITAIWAVAATAVVGGIAIAATVVTGGAAAGLVVLAAAAVIGSASAAINYAGQKASGAEEIDWCSVLISGFAGAISGAVAASPLGVPGQMIVNGALGGLQSFSMGGSWADITFSTGMGLIAGWLGGAGPKWTGKGSVFLPHVTSPVQGVTITHCTSTQFWYGFKTIWLGRSGLYISPQFGGLLSGVLKSTAFSNIPTFVSSLPRFIEDLWEKYNPDSEEIECNEEEEAYAK